VITLKHDLVKVAYVFTMKRAELNTVWAYNVFAVNISVSYSLIYVTCIMNVLKCNAYFPS